MPTPSKSIALLAADSPVSTRPSSYPEPFASRMTGRTKRQLGELFGLSTFGVNLTTLEPGASSALRHAHTLEDEFVYVVSGELTLHTDEGLTPLRTGMCAGFKAGSGNAHRLVNQSQSPATYLEVGSRDPCDEVAYPDEDLKGVVVNGEWQYQHKSGIPYK